MCHSGTSKYLLAAGHGVRPTHVSVYGRPLSPSTQQLNRTLRNELEIFPSITDTLTDIALRRSGIPFQFL